ncbi:MAG: tRNA uridine-5-carboxymethylaminomethyl(34) synthesis GTPase MnmE, partial [Bradyrhizobium sp.]|nr:tRNA uridine-5-carboxymethylaminomethyl(34) synthesis GTPase MnmE [Bradyrhizobium sp.]
IDTAGIRQTDDPVEQEGVRRARDRAAQADLVLWLTEDDQAELERQTDGPIWFVRNKIDLMITEQSGAISVSPESPVFAISARSGAGMSDLLEALVGFARDYFGSTEHGLITRERQRTLLSETAAALRRSIAVVDLGEELAAEELRIAALALGRLLGRVDVEDLLDVIFREFCIGK